jgi:mannose-1-phosphate guanylyltransferase
VQAVVLVGGQGTRLRPLTSTVPKPVVPLVDRPFMAYMLEWLAGHGVDDVVLSLGFMAGALRDVLGDGSRYGVRLRYVEEPEPLGTAGALKFAQEHLQERFLMLNGDVLSDMDLTAQIAQHEATGAVATLALVPVENPSAYGLVRIDDDRSVKGFVEKPAPEEIDTNLISAGAYVLERRVLDLIAPDANVSIEREVWPQLVGAGLFAYPHDAYWLDIGTPATYLEASLDLIAGRVHAAGVRRVGEGTQVAPDADVGDDVVLGPGVSVGAGARLERCVVLAGGVIGEGCALSDCILAPRVTLGERTVVAGGAVLGEGVSVGADNVLTNGVRVFPGTDLPDGAVRFPSS